MNSSGSEAQFKRFVSEFGERAFHFAYRLTGNIEEAKDLVSESFYRVLRSWDRYDRSRSLAAWYCTILRHVFLDGRKRYERRYAVSLDRSARPGGSEEAATYDELLSDQEETVIERLERAEVAEEVRRTLDRLAYDHRVVLTLCDMEGLSYDEMSMILDVPVGTVRSRISRARLAFRREFVSNRGEVR